MASPCACVARSTSWSRHPGPTCASLASASTVTSRMRDMSSVRPRSAIEVPAMLWPPPLMLSNRPWSRANPTAAATCGGRGRLEDERGGFRDHAVPDQHGVVPARVARAKQPGTRPASRARRAAPPSASRDRRRVRRRRWCSPSCAGSVCLPVELLSFASVMPLLSLSIGSTLRRWRGGDWRDSANSVTRLPSWPKTAGTVDDRCDDEQHRRGLRELLPAERQP